MNKIICNCDKAQIGICTVCSKYICKFCNIDGVCDTKICKDNPICYICKKIKQKIHIGKCANCTLLVCNKCAPNRLCKTKKCNDRNTCTRCNKVSLNIIHCSVCEGLVCTKCYDERDRICQSSKCKKIISSRLCTLCPYSYIYNTAKQRKNITLICVRCKNLGCSSCIKHNLCKYDNSVLKRIIDFKNNHCTKKCKTCSKEINNVKCKMCYKRFCQNCKSDVLAEYQYKFCINCITDFKCIICYNISNSICVICKQNVCNTCHDTYGNCCSDYCINTENIKKTTRATIVNRNTYCSECNTLVDKFLNKSTYLCKDCKFYRCVYCDWKSQTDNSHTHNYSLFSNPSKLHNLVKYCPKCKIPFELIEGCKHVICGKCKYSFNFYNGSMWMK